MMNFTQNDSGTFMVPYVPSGTRKTQILLPEGASERKIVAYKMRLRRDEPWFGNTRRCPYNFDIDEAGQDGVTFRHQAQLWMTGKLEKKYGQFIYQDSDQMFSSMYFEEWSEIENNRDPIGCWDRFVNREP
jgi:hypothetical protein